MLFSYLWGLWNENSLAQCYIVYNATSSHDFSFVHVYAMYNVQCSLLVVKNKAFVYLIFKVFQIILILRTGI